MQFRKLHFINGWAHTVPKSTLKAFIMSQYCYGGLNMQEVEVLFKLHELKHA